VRVAKSLAVARTRQPKRETDEGLFVIKILLGA
jgi:hypothetical protein